MAFLKREQKELKTIDFLVDFARECRKRNRIYLNRKIDRDVDLNKKPSKKDCNLVSRFIKP